MLIPPPARPRGWPVYAIVAVVAALAVVATWFAIAWTQARDDWSAANDAWQQATGDLLRADADGTDVAKARDDLLKAGGTAIVLFNTLDYQKVDQGLDAWERASAGELHDDVVSGRERSRQAIQNARSSTTAKALEVAVTELDARAGTGSLLAAMKVTLTAEGKPPQDKFTRIQAKAQRTPDGWKLTALTNVDFAR